MLTQSPKVFECGTARATPDNSQERETNKLNFLPRELWALITYKLKFTPYQHAIVSLTLLCYYVHAQIKPHTKLSYLLVNLEVFFNFVIASWSVKFKFCCYIYSRFSSDIEVSNFTWHVHILMPNVSACNSHHQYYPAHLFWHDVQARR